MTRTIDVELVVDARRRPGREPAVGRAERGCCGWTSSPGWSTASTSTPDETIVAIDLGPTVGAIATRHDGGFVLARNDGFALLDDDGAADRSLDVEATGPASA